MKETFYYLKNLLRDPNIASIAPTSSFGVKRMCAKMSFETAATVVEYGPALGVITRELLQRLSPAAKLVAIELNGDFAAKLREAVADPRLHLFNDTAANVLSCVQAAGASEADYVISGIPFTMLPEDVADDIVRKTFEVLRPGGSFIVYQFLQPERKRAKGIHRYLPRYFDLIEKERELLNVPPLRIYTGTKRQPH